MANLIDTLLDCFRTDWDGYDAFAVSPQTYHNARRFLEALTGAWPQPSVAADPDGEIALEWCRGPRMRFSVSIGLDATISYAGMFGTSTVHGTVSVEDKAPRARNALRDSCFATAIVTLLIALVCVVVRSPTPVTIRLDSQGTPRLYGLRLSNPKIRHWVYRCIGYLRPGEVRLSVPSRTTIRGVVRTLDDLRAAGVQPTITMMTQEEVETRHVKGTGANAGGPR